MRLLRDVVWVAAFEMGEALRTRLFQLAIGGYAAMMGLTTWFFIKLVAEAEARLAQTMLVPATRRPGAMLQTLLEKGELQDLLSPMLGSDNAAALLVSHPVLGLWAGFFAQLFLPMLLLFIASSSVASEIQSRSIRYLAARASRLSIVLGKLVGQVLVGGSAVVAGGIVVWAMGLGLMNGAPPVALAGELALRGAQAVAFSLPFIGLGLAASQVSPSGNVARVLSGGLAIGGAILHGFLIDSPDSPLDDKSHLASRLSDLALLFSPFRTWGRFWSPHASDALFGAAHAGALAVLVVTLGFLWFQRRDL